MQQHFDQLVHWIQLEAAAEARRLAERRSRKHGGQEERSGETLLNMQIVDSEPSLGGRYLVKLTKQRGKPLPWNRLRPGAPVIVSEMGSSDVDSSGVVSMRSATELHVVLEHWVDGNLLRVDMSPDEVTRGRQLAAISAALNAKGRQAQLRDIMLGERTPDFHAEADTELPPSLNQSQQSAVRFALSANDVAVIHGPPGTGKTTTVVEVIRQCVSQGERVLACGPSNTSVDNLLVKLVAQGVRAVRLGHPARVAKELQNNTLDALVERHENMQIVRDLRREAEDIFRKLDRHTRAKPRRGMRQELRAEAKMLKGQARALERQAVDHIVESADVLCMTTTGDDDLIRGQQFDTAVVDEACQSTEPGCWIPLLKADRLILAGDHCQLPPTIVSSEAAREGFNVSLMQRLVEHYGDQVTRTLTVQYRMHEDIMRFSSEEFYGGTLTADESVRCHLLSDLPGCSDPTVATPPVVFIDSAGAGWEEELEPDGESKLNREEARLIIKKTTELIEAGLAAEEIAVIAPYAAQVRLLRELSNGFGARTQYVEIDTVDGFQGREKEAVVISLVRSNPEGEIGFLADARRMNVAMTRAKRKLILVGDSATLGNNEFFVRLLDYFEKHGAYQTVWQEM